MTDRYILTLITGLVLLICVVASTPEIRQVDRNYGDKKSDITEVRNLSAVDYLVEKSQNGNESNESSLNTSHVGREGKKQGMHVLNLQYEYVQNPLLITIFLLAICILKIIIEHCHCLNQAIPESCLLMVFGLGIGFLLLQNNAKSELDFLKFSGRSFFLFLLPPIVLQSAYSLKDRAFSENLGTILLYAVLGTILNVAIVGPALYGFYQLGAMGAAWQVTFLECVLFGTIVAAVDPVAVLGIFQNMGVNKLLYFLVFGESLFNDGVTVVLYDTITSFMEIDTIGPKEFILGIAAFFCVCVGAMGIGIILGFMSAFITKYTEKIQTVEPFLLYGFAYLSYLLAELCNFSGIISLICCGLIQAHYAMENISSKSFISVHQFSKLQSGLAESLIFIILSVMAINVKKAWADFNIGFAVLAVFLCIVARFIVTCGLAFCVNRLLIGFRTIKKRDQFVMAYGGLRGAVTFSLCFSLNPNLLLEKTKTHNVLLTSAYIVIFFTTFLQGITMQPIVKFLQVKLHEDDSTLYNEINLMVMENTTACIERIAGTRGNNYWAAISKRLSRRFLRPLVNKKRDRKKVRSVLPEYWQARLLSAYSVDDSVLPEEITLPRGRLETLDILSETDEAPGIDPDAVLDLQESNAWQLRRASRDSGAVKDDGVTGVIQGVAAVIVEEQAAPGGSFVPASTEGQSLVNFCQENPSGSVAQFRAPMLKQLSDGPNRRENRRRKSSLFNVLPENQNAGAGAWRQHSADDAGVQNMAFAGDDTRV